MGLFALIGSKADVNDAVQEAHDRAVAAGEPGYVDPETGFFVFTAAELLARGRVLRLGLPPLSVS